jgi:hypothetical protein
LCAPAHALAIFGFHVSARVIRAHRNIFAGRDVRPMATQFCNKPPSGIGITDCTCGEGFGVRLSRFEPALQG